MRTTVFQEREHELGLEIRGKSLVKDLKGTSLEWDSELKEIKAEKSARAVCNLLLYRTSGLCWEESGRGAAGLGAEGLVRLNQAARLQSLI